MVDPLKPPQPFPSNPDQQYLLGRAREKMGLRSGVLEHVRAGRRLQKEADEQAIREGLIPPSLRLRLKKR
jgi:hypothetical protein